MKNPFGLCPAISLFALALSSLSPSAGAAELLINGGFESGIFNRDSSDTANPLYPYNTLYPADTDLTGWTVGKSVVWGYDPPDINVNSGYGYVDLTGVGNNAIDQNLFGNFYPATGHGSLSQTIATVLGQEYTFSIYSTQDTRSAPAGFDVYANATLLVLTGTPGFWDYTPAGAIWSQLTGKFIADSSLTTISIVGLSSNVFMTGLDDASVTGPVSAVPLPAAFPLIASSLGGMGLMGWWRRRRRHRAA